MPSQCEQYGDTVHLFIGTGRSPCKITSRPFAFDNNSIVIYLGLDSLFLFKSVSSFLPSCRSSLAHSVGAKAKTPPFARGLRCSRWSDRDKTGRDTLRWIRHSDEGLRRRLPAARPRSVPRPTCDLAHCNGPRVAASVLRA
jgi:hypothetical protein